MFSLVIPTYNRAPILKRALNHLLELDGMKDCEIIVVNDGSTDDTVEVLSAFERTASPILRAVTLTNGGPARARNCGVRMARNERILFVDDDVFPRPGMLQSHWRLLDRGYTASQGLLHWHQEIDITPLIRYIDSRGSQFAFDRVTDADHLDFAFIYTGNLAIDRGALLQAGGFDEAFFNRQLTFSVFEDTVLGYSLQQNGAKLALNREAVADHLNGITEDIYLRREFKVGYVTGLLTEERPAFARSLQLERKDFLLEPQASILRFLDAARLNRLFGYAFYMRLKNREAFCRGFLMSKQESSAKKKLSAQ